MLPNRFPKKSFSFGDGSGCELGCDAISEAREPSFSWASSQARARRASPEVYLWFCDGLQRRVRAHRHTQGKSLFAVQYAIRAQQTVLYEEKRTPDGSLIRHRTMCEGPTYRRIQRQGQIRILGHKECGFVETFSRGLEIFIQAFPYMFQLCGVKGFFHFCIFSIEVLSASSLVSLVFSSKRRKSLVFFENKFA